MSKIILIRHAQASLGKSNYDELSPLGIQQAKILGEYINHAGWQPDRIIAGSLIRHQQTAECILQALPQTLELESNPGWNEFNFTSLIQCFLRANPEQTPKVGDIRAFFSILKKSMLAWSNNELAVEGEQLESWNSFAERIRQAILDAGADSSDKPTLIVSSGGAIAMLLKQILEVNAKTMIELNFQIRNTSFTEIRFKPHRQNLVAFNQVNHLSGKQYKDFLTFA